MALITLVQTDDGYYCQIDRGSHKMIAQTDVRRDRDKALRDADDMFPGAELKNEIDTRKKRIMAKQKAKIKETFEYTNGTFRKMFIVSHNGQSQVYYIKKEAREAKKAIEKGE